MSEGSLIYTRMQDTEREGLCVRALVPIKTRIRVFHIAPVRLEVCNKFYMCSFAVVWFMHVDIIRLGSRGMVYKLTSGKKQARHFAILRYQNDKDTPHVISLFFCYKRR